LKAYTEDGDEVEVFSKEEHDAEVSKATSEKDTKVSELEKSIAELNEKLKGGENKETNFKALRDAKDKAEGELKGVKDEFSKQINDLRSELNAGKIKEKISSIAGGNEETIKKIEHFYNSFQAPKDGEQDIRLESAIKLAGIQPKSNMSGLGSGMGAPAGVGGKTNFTDEQKDLASKLGIKPEDLK